MIATAAKPKFAYKPFTFIKTRQGETLEVMGIPCLQHTVTRGYVEVITVRTPGDSKSLKRILLEDITEAAPKPEKMATPDPTIEELERKRVSYEERMLTGELSTAEELDGYLPVILALTKAGRTVQELPIR